MKYHISGAQSSSFCVFSSAVSRGDMNIRSESQMAHMRYGWTHLLKWSAQGQRSHIKCCCCSLIHLSCFQLYPTHHVVSTHITYRWFLEVPMVQNTNFIFLVVLLTENDNSVTLLPVSWMCRLSNLIKFGNNQISL